MTRGKSLSQLIEIAKTVRPTPRQWQEQRRSFAFGNTAFENADITRAMIDLADEKTPLGDVPGKADKP